MSRVAIVVVLAALGFAVWPAAAQGPFRITFTEKPGPTHTELVGRVSNEARFDCLDVALTAEATDANGKVVARGITNLPAPLRERNSAPFVIKVPAVPGTTGYRVSVSSFRQGLAGGQSP